MKKRSQELAAGARRIVVVGSSNTDLVVKVPVLPRPGETVLGGVFYSAAGGKGANQAVAAARAGGDVMLVAAVGTDAMGQAAVAGFAAEGIDTRHVLHLPEDPSGVALILVDGEGENSIAVASGANGRLAPEHVGALEPELTTAAVLVLQLEIPPETVETAARIASQGGARIILNPAPSTAPLPEDLLRRLAVITPNQHELEALTGVAPVNPAELAKGAAVLLRQGVGAVVVTMGAGGAFVATPEGEELVAGHSVPMEDAIGAGDVFNGALAAELAEGANLAEAVRFANAAAALSVGRRGAQPSAPRRAEILALLSPSSRC